MSKGGSKQAAPTTTVQTQTIPGFIEQAMANNISLANSAASNLAGPWTGPRTAAPSDTTTTAWNMAKNSVGLANPILGQAGTTLANAGGMDMPTVTAGGYDASKMGSYLNPMTAGSRAQSTGFTDAAITGAAGLLGRAASQGPQNVQAGTFANGLANINSLMNPFIGSVVDAARTTMTDSLKQNMNTIADGAIRANAFGGSRQGVMEGVAAAEGAKNLANLDATLRSQGFDKATGMIGQDIANNLSAQTTNANNQLASRQQTASIANALAGIGQTGQAAAMQGYNTAAGLQTNDLANALAAGIANQRTVPDFMKALTATGLGQAQIAGQTQQMNNADINMLAGVGAAQTGVSQQQINDQINLYNEQRQLPLDQLSIRMGAVSNTPVPTSTTSTTYGGGSSNSLLGGLGGALAGAQLGGVLSNAGLFSSGIGTGGGALLGGLLGLASDENLKTDVKKLGKDPASGIPMYSYRYKGDPKSYPKVVGPMAQDIERMIPGSVTKVGGKRVIRPNALAGMGV